MKEKAPAHFARNDGRRDGGCRGTEREHDESCPCERREKQRGKNERGKREGKNRGTSRACWLRNGVVSLDSGPRRISFY